MYKPPFSISDASLNMLGEIASLLPHSSSSAPDFEMSERYIRQTHAGLGGDGCYRHCGNNPHWIPVLTEALSKWLNQSPVHPIIRAAVFCLELHRISPFASGNELLIAALHRQLLISYHPSLEKAPFTQEMNLALAALDATQLISASLHAILTTLRRKPAAPRPSRQNAAPIDQLLNFIQKHPGCKRMDIMGGLPDISPRMLDRHLQTLRESGQIEYRGSRKTGAYFIP